MKISRLSYNDKKSLDKTRTTHSPDHRMVIVELDEDSNGLSMRKCLKKYSPRYTNAVIESVVPQNVNELRCGSRESNNREGSKHSVPDAQDTS